MDFKLGGKCSSTEVKDSFNRLQYLHFIATLFFLCPPLRTHFLRRIFEHAVQNYDDSKATAGGGGCHPSEDNMNMNLH